ncbi:MAG: archease [Nanoarchaeota archaeon]|nr:archease [Nanoarchaeota archaeon]
MGTYRFEEHTADEKFIVWGKDLEDAFSTCVEAFYEIIIPEEKVQGKITKNIEVSARRLRSLLYDFLNELVFFYDDQDLLLRNVNQLKITQDEKGYRLSATLSGDTHYDYEVEMEIKNMTYSDMEIKQDAGVEITVVVDI